MSDKTITSSSVPNHDSWGWDSFWSCNEWVLWHEAMVKDLGREEADRRWIKEYDDSSYGAHEILCSTQNNSFKDYVLKKGLANKSSILSRVYRAELATDTITEPVKNVVETVAAGTKTLKWIVPIAIVVIAGTAMYVGYRKLKMAGAV